MIVKAALEPDSKIIFDISHKVSVANTLSNRHRAAVNFVSGHHVQLLYSIVQCI